MIPTSVKVLVSVLVTAVIVGGSVYLWQQNKILQTEISLNTLSQLYREKMTATTTPAVTETPVVQNNVFQKIVVSEAVPYATDTQLKNLEVQLWGEPKEDLTDSCSAGYVSGDFTLALWDKEKNTVIGKQAMGEVTIPKTALGIIARGENFFVRVAEYGSCNGDLYSLHSLPTSKNSGFKQMNFFEGGSGQPKVFANKVDGVFFAGTPETPGSDFLAVMYYDNVEAKERTATYSWDGNMSFTRSN